ncbi:hypothetical protein SSX86_021454 [Deinandra increscens subsp. villosa]|uniref:F-box domain-containing protein n=1 Tax=Deinandra increscens subsp. villosa TaxID=3103831 RepID=A0AAP0GRQ9_9ASTR
MAARKKTAALAAELPLSIIECEILPRLPAKSVGRCMCVCKLWKSLLSTPVFTRMHLRNNVTDIDQYKLLMIDDHGTLTTLDGHVVHRNPEPLGPINYRFYVLASLDGLVCLGSVVTGLAFWNPLTGAYKKLAPIPCTISFWLCDGVGFYIDRSSNDYRLLYMKRGGIDGVYIYSHKLDSWRQIDFSEGLVSNHSSYDYVICSEATAFFGQCLYFVMTDSMYSGGSWIICFDVKTEKVRKIRFPHGVPAQDDNLTHASLVLLHGCIHLCVSYFVGDYSLPLPCKNFDMWRMDHGTDGWVKVFSEPVMFSISSQSFPLQRSICTATTTTNYDSLAALLDDDNNSFKKMNTEDFTTRYFRFPSLTHRSDRIIYVETLVSPA